MSAKTYKIRRFTNGRNKKGQPFINYSLTIPTTIAEKLPEGMTFSCELTDDGILFRPATDANSVQLPAWAGGEAKPNGAKRRTRARPGAKA